MFICLYIYIQNTNQVLDANQTAKSKKSGKNKKD